MKKPFGLRFEEENVNAWKTQAKKENRSLTNFIETVMTEYVSKKNKDKKPK